MSSARLGGIGSNGGDEATFDPKGRSVLNHEVGAAVRRLSRKRNSSMSIWDLESGSSFVGGGGGLVPASSVKWLVRKKRCALVATMIVLAACAVAALVGLNVIPRVPLGSVPPRLGVGQRGGPGGENTPEGDRALTSVPTEDGTASVIP